MRSILTLALLSIIAVSSITADEHVTQRFFGYEFVAARSVKRGAHVARIPAHWHRRGNQRCTLCDAQPATPPQRAPTSSINSQEVERLRAEVAGLRQQIATQDSANGAARSAAAANQHQLASLIERIDAQEFEDSTRAIDIAALFDRLDSADKAVARIGARINDQVKTAVGSAMERRSGDLDEQMGEQIKDEVKTAVGSAVLGKVMAYGLASGTPIGLGIAGLGGIVAWYRRRSPVRESTTVRNRPVVVDRSRTEQDFVEVPVTDKEAEAIKKAMRMMTADRPEVASVLKQLSDTAKLLQHGSQVERSGRFQMGWDDSLT